VTAKADAARLSAGSGVFETPAGCSLRIVGLDFESKTETALEVRTIEAALAAGTFVWVDVAYTDAESARATLAALGLIAPEIVEDALTREAATQVARYDDYVHFVVSGCRLVGDSFDLDRVDCAIGAKFLLTLHKGHVGFLDAVHRTYRADFERFAGSPSFLVYEIWDCLVDNYLNVQRLFEDRVEVLQKVLTDGVEDDRVFARVSELGSDILHFRKVVLPARAVLTDLSTRRTVFLTETTQKFLSNMVGTLERVLQDLLVDRDILSDSLDLHMSVVTHRTNQVMKKLTVVNVVFLPLTFLCGIYGMNFERFPELRWSFGYAWFWFLVTVIIAAVVWLSRRARLL
jgi:magnesium transporter